MRPRIAEAAPAGRYRARFFAIWSYSRCIAARVAHLSPSLIPAGVALIYVTSLSVILVQDWNEPKLLVVAVFALSLLAGLLIKRFSALLLPLAAIVLSRLWVPLVDEDPIFAMLAGLLVGVVLGRAFDRTPRRVQSEPTQSDARAHRSPRLKRLAKRIVTREGIDTVLDHVRFRIDTFPHGVYQPVASLPRVRATRGLGSESRWEAILPVVREQAVETAVDIGACEGYFSIKLAEAGITTIALEGDAGASRTAMFAVRRSGLDNVGVLALALTPGNVTAVPASDCTIFFSIWHHLVRYYGADAATQMMATIWARTGKVLFFDTGENEMTPEYGLPAMTPDARSWLTSYLAETCPGSRVEHLGTHKAFDPHGQPVERNLFAVIRV